MISYALVPHKDTLFLLASIQRKFISHAAQSNFILFPQYPLWAFFDEHQIECKNISSCTIEKPARDGSYFYFPVSIISSNQKGEQHSDTMRIVFASCSDEIKNASEVPFMVESNAFPLTQRVFRIGSTTRQDNGWALTDDQWIKLQ